MSNQSKSTDSARNLQTPGDELYRHDLTIFFLSHPCQLEVFNAQIEACETDADVAEVVRQTWEDLIPAHVKFSNRGPETREDRKLRSLMATSCYYQVAR